MCAVILNGCVFKRLLEFQKQMETPATYISFEKEGILEFKKPVLELDDLVLLTGIEPTTVTNQSNQTTIATYDFIRDDHPKYSLTYQCIFKNSKLVMIDYPDQFYSQVSSSFAFQTLETFGKSKLDSTKSWKLRASRMIKKLFIPTKKLIKKLVGPPTTKTSYPLTDYYTYSYRHPIQNGSQKISISYEFSKKNQQISMIFIQFPDRNWELKL